MESGLEDRNNERPFHGLVLFDVVVSMESGLEDRNNTYGSIGERINIMSSQWSPA